MNRKIFNQYIAESNFKELFISEMGWNNPHGQTTFELDIDDTEYALQLVAERNGFQVLTCAVHKLPTSSLCKKFDTRLRRSANDYICIFYVQKSTHHLWAVPVKKVEKRDIVLVEYSSVDAASFLYEKMNNLSFGLDEQTTITDVVAKVQSAFIINSERITKDFYTGFKKEHAKFAQFIRGIDDHIADKDNRKKQWYTSVMLNRLMFCYFIQKKGFLDGDVNYLRHKLEWTQKEKGENRFFNSFYKGFLITLFHGGLNAPEHDSTFENNYGRIPYLNGGMFDVHQLELEYEGLDIADDAFISLFNFFDRWHWHLDDRITATGRDINPDVLGYIFEQYINDRAQMGAYYTKEDITEYISRNTILPYLMNSTRNQYEYPFSNEGEVWTFLRNSGDKYLFGAMKKGAELTIPKEIAVGIDPQKPNLLERRKRWNDRTSEIFGLPTEIWRETIERLQRYNIIKAKVESGELSNVNDFITYNLDIRQFVFDLLNNTQDYRLIGAFYSELQKLTILDPTCGSGAFLFAALNILEPLYEVCLARMKEFHRKDNNLFSKELDEIANKYRSNIQYFIYKSIILRNLYGVDIMVEATEIAKLRLFLKMVAVVDVDRRDPNMGLDPLPDIDFNIRCGNTLVGYATEKELLSGIAKDIVASGFSDTLYEKMGHVSEAYQKFKNLQLMQTEEPDAFKRVKSELKQNLNELNELLNRVLYHSTTSEEAMTYDCWLKTHQPFHWLAEFYEIVNDHGGFDVIIGNPPYVVYNIRTFTYQLKDFETISAKNLYAYCVERSLRLLNSSGRMSMIVPISLSNGTNFKSVRRLLSRRGCVHYSHYAGDSHPSCLFNGVQQNLTIFVSSPQCEQRVFSTKYIKFYTEERPNLYGTIIYFEVKEKDCNILRISSLIQQNIVEKINKHKDISSWICNNTKYRLYFKNTSGAAYKPFFSEEPYFEVDGVLQVSKTIDFISFKSENEAASALALYNSNLFNFLYYLVSDARHITHRETLNLVKVDDLMATDKSLHELSAQLENDYHRHSTFVVYYKKNGITKYEQFNPRLSKPIIDEIDKAIAKHYGFTAEELDFIINYDIKYRIGDELENEG